MAQINIARYFATHDIIKSKSGTNTYDSPEKNENGIVSPKSDIFTLDVLFKKISMICKIWFQKCVTIG